MAIELLHDQARRHPKSSDVAGLVIMSCRLFSQIEYDMSYVSSNKYRCERSHGEIRKVRDGVYTSVHPSDRELVMLYS